LSRVKVNSTNTTSSVATTTTGPTAVAGAKTVVSTNTTSVSNQTVNPSTAPTITSTINTTPVPVAGFPATTTSGASTTVTTKTQYTTTQTTVTNTNVVRTGPSGARRYAYDITTKVESWTTTTTSTVTKTTTTTTTTTQIPLPTTTNFKVLIANQAYSPAVKVKIGGGAYVDVFSYQTTNGLNVTDIPSYNLSTIGTLQFNLPLDAFDIKDWKAFAGVTGAKEDKRAGLHPIKWSCAVSNAIAGPEGEWRNGALTFQIVDASIVQTDIEMNVIGKPELGYRLKPASLDAKLIAEYTTFWHHPNDKCMGDNGWKKDPAQDPINDAIAVNLPTGSNDDPKGIFGVNPNPGGTAGTASDTKVTVVNNTNGTTTTTTVVTTTVTNADGSTNTTIKTTTSTTSVSSNGNADIDTGGAVNTGGTINTDGTDTRTKAASVGRINWRELQR
jgi:type IV pilus assembly protein PilY1